MLPILTIANAVPKEKNLWHDICTQKKNKNILRLPLDKSDNIFILRV